MRCESFDTARVGCYNDNSNGPHRTDKREYTALAVTGPLVRIVAPAIGLDAPVVPVGRKRITLNDDTITVWEVATQAAGWHEDSAAPGMEGNVVLSEHHDKDGEAFRYVVDLEPGDTVTLYTEERPYTYTVEARFVVRDKGMPEETRRENARWIGSYPDQRVTLVTCWPYSTNTHRVIVVARPGRYPAYAQPPTR